MCTHTHTSPARSCRPIYHLFVYSRKISTWNIKSVAFETIFGPCSAVSTVFTILLHALRIAFVRIVFSMGKIYTQTNKKHSLAAFFGVFEVERMYLVLFFFLEGERPRRWWWWWWCSKNMTKLTTVTTKQKFYRSKVNAKQNRKKKQSHRLPCKCVCFYARSAQTVVFVQYTKCNERPQSRIHIDLFMPTKMP